MYWYASKVKYKKRLRSSNSSAGEDDDSQIIEELVSIQERIENGFTKIGKEIAALKCELKEDIKSVRVELNDATKSLNAAWEEVSSLQEKNKILQQQQLDSTAEENVKLKEDFEALRVRIVKQEDYSRRENLRFNNIPESAQETNDDCIQKVKQVLSDLGAPSDIKFHAIHRTGKPNNYGASSTSQGEPRPRLMMARFVSRKDSESISFMRKELLKSPRFSTVLIDIFHLNRHENEQNFEPLTRKLRI